MATIKAKTVVNMLEAKTQLSRLVDAVERGEEAEIVIARNGRPAARLVPIERKRGGVKIGLAKGKYRVPDWFFDPETDREIERMIMESPRFRNEP